MSIFNRKPGAHQWRGVINEYRHRLPVTESTPVITLNEGGTPLIFACNLSELLKNNVWIKYEGLNPTGSFKDRGMTRWIQSCYLCINRKYIGIRCGVCSQSRNGSCSIDS